MKYINKDIQGIYADFDFELDSNYSQGNSLDDYKTGKWVKLSDEQVAFHEANTTASIEEVFAMKLNEQPDTQTTELEKARLAKLEEIKKQDDFSNKFFVSATIGGKEVANKELWLDKSARNSLLNLTLPSLQSDGQTTTKLWTTSIPPQSLEVPISWALEKLPLVEIYAKRTYDLRASNEAAAYSANTIVEINSIDIKANYPLFLTLELKLDA